ncbi:MAG TPA: arginyltransferase, partial [Candidatus Acidoferrales bacterium]|nr:arginyltransferase [Candidatus Acidoferrales bacterium]
QRTARLPQFFLTPGGPCPYLPDRVERKVFARLNGLIAQPLNEALTHSGFRRSQMIAYRPACDGCNACVSVRIVAGEFEDARGARRNRRRNADLQRTEVAAEATREQFALLRAYLDSRHPGGGMSDMGLFDYVAMVEETPVKTHIVEYRKPSKGTEPGQLMACALTDVLRDGLSMVYSFYHPGEISRSIGTHMILDHVEAARARGLPYVYLGYWIEGSAKMDYKSRFRPLETLRPEGWVRLRA